MQKAHAQFNFIVIVGLALACLAGLTHTAAAQTNPVPLINDPLVPGSAVPGGKSFTLTVNGTGFASGASVLWNGVALLTVVNSQSKLTATVPAADIATAGTALVNVTNPKASQASNVLAFPVTQASTAVAFAGFSQVGTLYAQTLGVADFNADGNLDVALLDGQGNINVLLGHGDGTFSAPVVSLLGAPTAYGAVISDFNGDGKLDIATSYVGIYFGNGDGTFTAGPQYPEGPYGGAEISAGDFNRDGLVDLAVVACGNYCTTYVLLGQGNGTFQNDGGTDGASGSPPAVGDFNRDGKLDLAESTYLSYTYLPLILLGNGDGSFQNGITYGTTEMSTVSTADFNGDGLLDLAGVDISYSAVDILFGNGDGTFGSAVKYSTASQAYNLFVGDFNGDGKPDVLAVTNTGTASLLLGNGDGTFQNHVDYSLGTSGSVQAIGDFNRDGKLDFVTAGFGQDVVSVFLQTAAQLSPTSLTFGDQSIGTTSPPQTVTLTNVGNSTMTISGVAVTGTNSGDFAQTNTCGTNLVAGASCAISVTFTPTVTGTRAASLSVTDSAVGSPQTVSLTGTGTQATVTLSPTSLTFGVILVKSSTQPKPVTLTNTGNGSLAITNLSTTGDFSQTNTCGSSVAAGTSCIINVTFKPTATGTRTGTLSITDNAPGSPQTVALTGTGTVVKLSAASINFGSQKVGTTSPPVPVALGNAGTTPLGISSIKIGGADPEDFAETNNCGQSLEAGKSCTITVRFTPTATGTRSAWLGISDNGGGSPQRVALSGDGT
ncbi:MAG TPA: choice-of-anchor D domain-containing protein [Terriglobia bacterium]|nr:choice-of-anchor D domain-containing protein [Terriglobia bacterium]